MQTEGPHPHLKSNEPRKRKSHTKSRKGCGNCKLRRVKCDETRPQCQKCLTFGVTCNYTNPDSTTTSADAELQLPGEGAFTFSTTPHSLGPGFGPAPPTYPDVPKDSLSPVSHEDRQIDGMLGMPLDLHETDEVYHLTKEDLGLLRMFRNRTVFTIGTAQSVRKYQAELINLCFNANYLTHIILTLTLMHDRCLSIDTLSSTSLSAKESFHWYHGMGLFNAVLSQPIREEDKDPLWGCAALLGACTIASFTATKPEEAWPLRAEHESDLDWLRMSDGKKAVWRLVDPLREGSVWRDVLNYQTEKDPEPYNHAIPELKMLAPYLTKIYDFDPLTTKPEEDQDPYHTAASILVRLLELDCNHSTIMYFLSFLGHMDERFRRLLHVKDPKALLLLAWWYGKMCQYNVWWQSRRMVLEGQAICLYLERYHGDCVDIVKLLDYPKMMTGLIPA